MRWHSGALSRAFVGCLLLGGCVTVPELEPNNIQIAQVIDRVKCDLADALPDPDLLKRTDPALYEKYRWIEEWVARVDLSLIINETAGLTPTVSFIDLRNTAIVKNVGNIMQNFTLGAGLGASTNAVRTDNMTFTISVKELHSERRRHICRFSPGIGLSGDLGLKEWVASALEPVEREQLVCGKHPAIPRGAVAGARRPLPRCVGQDPPIDIISHQAQFVVVLSGNISPNWSLARFKGPAVTGSLAAASRARTHTLAVIMASPRPSRATSGAHGSEAIRLQLQQIQQLQELRVSPSQ